jgi:hypothetical protein
MAIKQAIDTNTYEALKSAGWDTSGFTVQDTTNQSSTGNPTQQALNAGADPPTLAWAKAHMNSKDYNGYCEQFVGDALGEPYPRTGKGSAIDTWNNDPNKVADPSLKGAKQGDRIYFSPNQSNATLDYPNGAGHTGFYEGNGQFISATDNGVQENDLNNWNKTNGTQVLGYIPVNQSSQTSPNPNVVPTPTMPTPTMSTTTQPTTTQPTKNSNSYNLPTPGATGLPQIMPTQNRQTTGMNMNPLSPSLPPITNSIYIPKKYEYR